MTVVIRIRGKARDVFGCLDQMAKKAGKLTIGELAKLKNK